MRGILQPVSSIRLPIRRPDGNHLHQLKRAAQILGHFLPKNSETQALFSGAVRYMEETDDKYHLQFIDSLGNEAARVTEPITTPLLNLQSRKSRVFIILSFHFVTTIRRSFYIWDGWPVEERRTCKIAMSISSLLNLVILKVGMWRTCTYAFDSIAFPAC